MYALMIAGAFQLLNQLMLNIPKWLAAGRQSGEFTAEQEAEWQAMYQAKLKEAHWQPDSTKTPPP